MGLKQKTVKGLFWTFGQQFSSQIIGFSVSIILARLLSPSDFGLIGMLSIFIYLGNSLMDSGMTSSIIRTVDADQSDYSTVFLINMIGSVIIYILVFLAAPFIASFYEQPLLKNIIRIYSLTFVITASIGVQSAKLTKEMRFKVQMIMQIPSVVIGGIAGILFAYNGYGVWSLVYMTLIQNLLLSLQHWIYSGWRPNLTFDHRKFKHHFAFGYKITLSGLLATAYENIFTVIIGKYYSAAQLGFYTRALSLRQLPISNLSAALNKVTYPMLSSMNTDDVKLKEVYRKLMQQVVFWIIPFLILSIIIAEPLIRFLLTEKWLPAVPFFQILCLSGMLLPLQGYNGNILKVKGRTDILLKIQVFQKIFGVTGIILVVPFGIHGLLYFQLFSAVVDYNFGAYYGGRMIKYPIFEQLKDILPSIGVALITGFLIWVLDTFLARFNTSDLGRLLIGVSFYSAIYLSLSILIKLAAINDFKELILKR